MGGGGGGPPKPTSGGHGPSAAFAPMLKRGAHADAEFDITAMIDLVFMMNIYFLVTFLTAASAEIDLPFADHASALDGDTCVTMTLLSTGDGNGSIKVVLANEESNDEFLDPESQEEAVKEFADKGVALGKKNILIKAEKNIRLREIQRISAAASVEGSELHVAVMEKDE